MPKTDYNATVVFRPIGGGHYEKCFSDYNAKPRRAYRTGEIWREVPETEPEDPVSEYTRIVRPDDLTWIKLERVSPVGEGISFNPSSLESCRCGREAQYKHQHGQIACASCVPRDPELPWRSLDGLWSPLR